MHRLILCLICYSQCLFGGIDLQKYYEEKKEWHFNQGKKHYNQAFHACIATWNFKERDQYLTLWRKGTDWHLLDIPHSQCINLIIALFDNQPPPYSCDWLKIRENLSYCKHHYEMVELLEKWLKKD